MFLDWMNKAQRELSDIAYTEEEGKDYPDMLGMIGAVELLKTNISQVVIKIASEMTESD
jgi:hypothetical protein